MTPEQMAAALDAHADFRVLRRLDPAKIISKAPGTAYAAAVKTGLVVDVETTGLDTECDEVIEIAAVPFEYSAATGAILAIGEPFNCLRDPGRPVPAEITELTGITDAMVEGQTVDLASLSLLAGLAAPIISHRAAFDRPFLERIHEVFARRPWACSVTQIDWQAEGLAGAKLEYLAMAAGFFYEKHRAVDDCLAVLALLAAPLPRSRAPALLHLLENGRKPSWRIKAIGSPFAFKDALKARGYTWNPEGKCWVGDVADPNAELDWLQANAYYPDQPPGDLPITKITAFNRFTEGV